METVENIISQTLNGELKLISVTRLVKHITTSTKTKQVANTKTKTATLIEYSTNRYGKQFYLVAFGNRIPVRSNYATELLAKMQKVKTDADAIKLIELAQLSSQFLTSPYTAILKQFADVVAINDKLKLAVQQTSRRQYFTANNAEINRSLYNKLLTIKANVNLIRSLSQQEQIDNLAVVRRIIKQYDKLMDELKQQQQQQQQQQQNNNKTTTTTVKRNDTAILN